MILDNDKATSGLHPPEWQVPKILLKQMSLASRQRPEREELLAGTGRISR